MQAPPIILTLMLDETSQTYFTNLRKKYFPAEINYLDAHLTLFHHLPANNEKLVIETVQKITKQPSFNIAITSIKNIGNGTAFIISSSTLQAMHKIMQQIFAGFLIPQDKQKLWPHITIQNKVDTLMAKQTTEFLNQDFKPFTAQGVGITAWYYLNGPWKEMEKFLFAV